jgi:hypothetical protein
LRKAKRDGLAYVIIDGTLIPVDRIAAGRPFYSGKHKRHGVNLRVAASPDGTILWVSGELPGSTHDTAAARIWNILAALRESGLIALGDKGYHGYDETRERVTTPYKGKNKPDSQKDANRAHARLRGPGERANASSSTGASCTKSASAHAGSVDSPKPSTCYRTTKQPQDEKGSLHARKIARDMTLIPSASRSTALTHSSSAFLSERPSLYVLRLACEGTRSGHRRPGRGSLTGWQP